MLKIKWIGQAGYILSDETTTICIDPYLSDVVNRVANRPRTVVAPFLPEELKADAVICTHNHLDHVDIDSIPYMDKNIQFFAPRDCKEVLTELGVTHYNEFDEGKSYNIGDFIIVSVFADHTVPAVGVVVKNKKNTLYFTSDTLYNEKLTEVKCDILFICINGKLGNMNVEEAMKITRQISPKTAVPNHYDMFESNLENPENFRVPNRFIMEFNKEYGGEFLRRFLCYARPSVAFAQ